MKQAFFLFLFTLASIAAGTVPIPMEDFFKDPLFDEIQISPDGTKVAALSMWKGNLNLYVIDLKTKKPAMLTGMTTMGVSDVRWVGSHRLIFSGTEEGNHIGGLFAIDADGKNSMTLAKSAAQAGAEGAHIYRSMDYLSPYGDSDTEILVTSNERRGYDPDVYRLNVHTGTKKMVAWNPGKIVDWLPDNKGAVRVGVGMEDRDLFLIYREGSKGDFKRVKTWSRDGKINLLGFDQENQYIYVRSSMGRNTEAICLMDPKSGEVIKVLFEDPTYDAGALVQDRHGKLLGFGIYRERPAAVFVDEFFRKTREAIDSALPGTYNSITSRSLDNEWFIVRAWSDRDPGTYYIFNTKQYTLEKLVARMPWLKPEQLSECRPIVYTARDGLTIHGYLTLPAGHDPKNLPLVVNPHGGPWVRDHWGFQDEVQFLASRGYAVLQMNFRGSTGYGRKHEEAGYNQWGLAMQDDITDGVKWAIAQGYADPKRIAIYGASYGGYACMAGLAFTPELYRCGINYVGVTDIALLQKTIPESWERMRADLENKTGNSKADRERLAETSPLKNVDRIRAPVFFAYGEQDERVDMKHGTRMYSSLKSRGIPVEWMSRVDEGHGYRRKENVHDLYRAMEAFLAKYMTKEPVATVTIGETKLLEMPAK